MKAEFVPMNFDALLASLASGKVDMVGGSMSITAERQKSVDFVGPYYDGGITLVILEERLEK
jgi:polar amino acid transport system substrate-binding protein